MKALSPYLYFKKETKEAFDFYRAVLGGEFNPHVRYSDMPGMDLSPQEAAKTMHIALHLPNGYILMGTDLLEKEAANSIVGNNFVLSLTAETKAEAEKIYHGLSEGGKILTALAVTSWGDYLGMFIDKFGIKWIVNFENAQPAH